MQYLKFEKDQLVNLGYSLKKEIIRTNRAGSYASSTIVGCNTRKYHGLLVAPLSQFENERFVLLSSLDETVVQHKEEFNLGIHKYQGGLYIPKGHKYIRDFETDVLPRLTYRVGDVVLTKEKLLVEKEPKILIKYTLQEANAPAKLRLSPFLSFRNIHALSHANMDCNTKGRAVQNGMSYKLYSGFPRLYLQLSKKNEFVHFPDWYYNVEYLEEMERGYDYKEDLFVPGYFEFPLKMGESVIFSASLKQETPASFKRKFTSEQTKKMPRNSYKNCLINSAQQFFVRKDRSTEILAGYHWFGSWGRDTFISLPGLTLAIDDPEACKSVLDSMVKRLKDGLFPNTMQENNFVYNSADAPLWFFYALYEYDKYINDSEFVWKTYKNPIKKILDNYKRGTHYGIGMTDEGLIYCGEKGQAITWMDAVVHGKPITPREGLVVEINALWFHAVSFALDLAEKNNDKKFLKEWFDLPQRIKNAFLNRFWDHEKGYLADYIEGDYVNRDFRPNQVIAASLPFSMLNDDMIFSINELIKNELLTPKGLRTLSPKNPAYIGVYSGNQEERDRAYHQGTVWPWLLEHYAKSEVRIRNKTALPGLKAIYDGFEEDLLQHGIGSISEIYDGDPPHNPKGAISQAWSVAAILQIGKLIEVLEDKVDK
jgi:predicted glycogen debranching enzyme